MKSLGFLVVSVALLSGDAALNDARSSEQELADEIYAYIMNKALKEKVDVGFGEAATVGKTNPYRSEEYHKVFAACLTFRSEKVDGITVKGWWTSTNYRRATKARTTAMNNCKSSYGNKYGCECFIIDVNDSSYVSRSGILNMVTGSAVGTSSDSWARFRGYDDLRLCRAALTGGGTRWETSPTWLPAVEEAQERGFSIEDCRNIVD